MIVIVGATGTIGGVLLQRLAGQGTPVRALSREPRKLRDKFGTIGSDALEFAYADAADHESLHSAFLGASQLFLALSNSPQQVEQETAIVRIAKEAGIGHIVKISSPPFDPLAPVAVAGWHREIEQCLAESGLVHTILRPYAFMQNLLRHAPSIAQQNVFVGTMGDAVCNFVDCRDIADVAAEALTRTEVAGRIYTLTGSEVFSYPQIAAKLSALLDRPIRYVNMAPDDLRRTLIEHAHMPDWLANHVVEIQAMSVALPEQPTDDVKRVLGKEPRTVDAFLREHADRFR